MAEVENEELLVLKKEYEWLLAEEVTLILRQIQSLIMECSRRFPISLDGVESLMKSEKFVMTNASPSQDQVKATVTLNGDNISHADINLRLHKHTVPGHRTIVQNDCQWKLQQIQDAGNHLIGALHVFEIQRWDMVNQKFDFQSADEVIQMVNGLMGFLQRGRESLIMPKKRKIEDLQSSRNMKSLQPPLPGDLAVSFYVQSHKLVFAVYHIQQDIHGQKKFDVFQAESSIPWLSEALVLFTVALQLCQQLKDKVSVFSQYIEMNLF